MSIIDDVRIKQDIDKDGKYVCDLNHKEETKFDIHLREAMASNTPVIDMSTNFTLDIDGVHVPGTEIVIPPTIYVNIALKWLQNSKELKWGMKDHPVGRKTCIQSLITNLQKLI